MKKRKGSSDRSFGLLFALVFAFLGVWPLLAGHDVRVPYLFASGVFLIIVAIRPGLLHPMNRAWTKLGVVMGHVVNPVVTSVLFVLVFVPAGAISRLLRKDPLGLRALPSANSYWIDYQAKGPPSVTMPKQF